MKSTPNPNPFYISLFIFATTFILCKHYPSVIDDYPFLFCLAILNGVILPLMFICHITGEWK